MQRRRVINQSIGETNLGAIQFKSKQQPRNAERSNNIRQESVR